MAFGEVLLEAHLALEVGEQRFDHESDAGFGDLARWAFAELVALGGDECDADEVHRGVELFAPETLVGEQDAARVSTGEIQGALALLTGLGADEVIADGDAVDVADDDQTHAPDVLAFGRAVAEARVPGELAAMLAARVVRAADQRPVNEADRVLSDQLGDHHLDLGDLRDQAPQPAVVLRLVGQCREPPRQQPPDLAK